MTVKRTNMSDIVDVAIYLTTTGKLTRRGGYEMELRERATDRLIATVDSDDLFDRNGNRFHYDCD